MTADEVRRSSSFRQGTTRFSSRLASVSAPNSLNPCSNSVHSLICGNKLPVAVNSLACSATQGIPPQALESAGPSRTDHARFQKDSLLISLYSE
jgi:hypothetical protein